MEDEYQTFEPISPTLNLNHNKENKTLQKLKSFVNKMNIINNNVNEEEKDKEKDIIFLRELFNYIETYMVNMDNIDEIDRNLYFKYFLKLIFYDYIIFLPSNFFIKTYYLIKQKTDFLKYLNKYNVIYFAYEDKNLILSIMGYLNNFIKNTKEEIQKTLIKKILVPNIDYLERKYFDGRNHVLTKLIHQMKFKEIYFQDSIIEPNILYKKISFSNQELFLNLNQYSMKRVEYKLRSFCQIAEELGAQLIDIKYNYIKNEKSSLDIGLKANAINIGGNTNESKDSKDEINLKFEYPSNHIHINLNKYSLINKIIKENQFLLSKDEFESDVELKYLIDARCTSFIQKYNTQFTVESCNFIEKKLYLEAQKYGINFDSTFLNNHSINLSIYVEFFPLIENPHIIDGTNIHVLREGFLFLMRLIDTEINSLNEKGLLNQEEKRKVYRKLIQYLKTHIYAIENNWINLNYDYYFHENVSKILKQMIEKNFKQEEFEDYIIQYFENHMGWSGFLNLRNTILKGDLNGLDKLAFISTQYMDILIYKKTIIDNINKFIDDELKHEIIEFLNINYENKYNLQEIFIEKVKEELLIKIKNLIIQVFRKSFYIYNGLSNNQDYESLKIIIYHLLIYNYENQVFDISKVLEEKRKNYKFKSNINNIHFKSKISIWIDRVLKYLDQNNYFVKEEVSPIKNGPSQNMELGLTCVDNNIDISNNINKENDINITSEPYQNIVKKNKNKKINNINNINNIQDIEDIIICTTLIDRQRKYFVKFIIRYFQYNHQMEKLFKYFKINSENNDDIEYYLYNTVYDFYSINKLYSNYMSYRLFFSYDDFEFIIHKIKNKEKICSDIKNKLNMIKKLKDNKTKKEKILNYKNKELKKIKKEKKDINQKEQLNKNEENNNTNKDDLEDNRLNSSILYIFKYIYQKFVNKDTK